MYRSSRPRGREKPPIAAEFRRRRARMSPAPAEGHCQFRKQPNASRIAFDSACTIGFSAEENSFALENRRSSSKKSSGIPMKELIDEEMSKEKQIRYPSPSLIARLMGLYTLPSPLRQQKNMDSCYQKKSSVGPLDPEDCSQWRSMNEDQDLKDVFEVMETSKVRKHMNHSHSKEMLRCRGNDEADMHHMRQRFMDTKHLSTQEMPKNSQVFNDAFEVPDSSKDPFVELLPDPNSLFAKHFQDLNRAPPSPHQSKITILKPSKGAKHWSNVVQCKSSKTERNHDRCSRMQQEVTGSFKMHAARRKKHYVEDNYVSGSHNSLASQHVGRPETCVHPDHIVILKPSLKKAQKMAEANFSTHENFWFSSKKFREIAASRIHELHDEGRDKHKLSRYTEVLNHKVKDSSEIAREITRKMRHAISNHTKKKLTSKMNQYPGTGDSFIMPGISKPIHSEAIHQNPDPFIEWSTSFSPSSSYSTESSVNREAQNCLSERWKITHQFQNLGLMSQDSSTLGEMLVLSDRETPKVTVETLNTKNVSDEKLASNEVLGGKGCHFGISSKDAWRDGSSRLLPRSNSLPASCSPKLSNRKLDGGCGTTMVKDALDMELSISSDANFSMPGILLVKSSEHQDHKSQPAHSVGEENMLPEREIHVNSEGLKKRIHVRSLLDKTTLHPAPTDYAITERNQLTNSASIPIPGDWSWHLTTQEEQVMQTAFQVPSQNEGLFGHVQNDIVIEEKTSDHPQVKLLLSESDMAKSHPLSSKDLEQPSPVSVLQTPSEDETYSSGCFERLSADLKELRMQLHRLKLETVATYVEETEVLMLSNEGCAKDNHVLLPSGELHRGFRDDDDRDFTYLLDILTGSGFHGIDDNKLLDVCHLLGSPVDQNVFDKLEKKYEGIASWSRPERKLLFDLINCTLAGLVTPYMHVHPQVTTKIFRPAQDREGIVEGLWQIVVKQRKEPHRNQEDKVLEPGWLGLEYDVNLIGIEMERMLSADLLEELVSEFVLA